jgi:cyclopropane fatty-acyl-phospholipid synthase-like methyltransferase
MDHKKYLNNVAYCESFFKKYGDTYKGVGWTKTKEDVDKRYRVMLELIEYNSADENINHKSLGEKVRLLDFGCGLSHLYEYILRQQIDYIEYSGLDLSQEFITASKAKFPYITYYDLDVINNHKNLPLFDYIVMNGVFTGKRNFSHEEMLEYFQVVVTKVFNKARAGIAFNVMSKQVEWEREDLFHLPFDVLASFLSSSVSRNFIFRHDYGLYEYTAYVYR